MAAPHRRGTSAPPNAAVLAAPRQTRRGSPENSARKRSPPEKGTPKKGRIFPPSTRPKSPRHIHNAAHTPPRHILSGAHTPPRHFERGTPHLRRGTSASTHTNRRGTSATTSHLDERGTSASTHINRRGTSTTRRNTRQKQPAPNAPQALHKREFFKPSKLPTANGEARRGTSSRACASTETPTPKSGGVD